MKPHPQVSICVLTYGDYPALVQRCLGSIAKHCDRNLYQLIAGANEVSAATRTYLRQLKSSGAIDQLVESKKNLNKCPMMRKMFALVRTPLIWWFDDDSYLTSSHALERHLGRVNKSPRSVVMWGQEAECRHPSDFINLADLRQFVREAPWYGGLTPPSWAPGGKGEFNWDGRGTGDGRWRFIVGGCWLIRTRAVRALNWPDRRLLKLGDDVLLGEAVRQQGWRIYNTGGVGTAINTATRRGYAGRIE